jgi:aspartate 1-decarboxylase
MITYVIEAASASGTVLLNGPAARLGVPGDSLIILAYCAVSDEEAAALRPIVVHVDEQNRPLQS